MLRTDRNEDAEMKTIMARNTTAALPKIRRPWKPLAVVAMACLPLAVLVGASAVQWAATARTPQAAGPPADPADSDARRLEAYQQVCESLEGADPFAPQPVTVQAEASAPIELAALPRAWNRWVEECQLLAGLGDYLDLPADSDLAKLKLFQQQLTGFCARLSADRSAGRDVIAKQLSDNLARLGNEIKEREFRQAVSDELDVAETAYHRREYAKCLASCDRLFGEYRHGVDVPAVTRRRALAEFWNRQQQAAAELQKVQEVLLQSEGSGDPPASLAKTVEQAKDFVANSATVTLADEAEKAELAAWKAEVDRVERRYKDWTLRREGRVALEQFRRALPASFPARLAGAARILDRYPVEEVQKQLAGDAPQWVGAALVDKKCKSADSSLEAKSKVYGYLRGQFRKTTDQQGKEGYVFSTSSNGAGGFHPKDEFDAEPGKPFPRRFVAQYQAALEGLRASPQQRKKWEDLAEVCCRLQSELEEYRRTGSATAEAADDLSFHKEAELARAVVDKHWAVMEKLLGP